MKEHLVLFPALVAFAVFGNGAGRSLQMPVQLQQSGLRGQGVGPSGTGSFGGGFGGGAGEGSPGLFGGSPDGRQDAGVATGPRETLGGGGGGGRPEGFGSLGSGNNGGSGSLGFGGVGEFGSGSGSGVPSGFPSGLNSNTGVGEGLGFGAGSPAGNLGAGFRGPGGSLSTGGFGSPRETGPGGSVSGGPLSGTRGSSGLPGLEGERLSPSGALTPFGNTGNALGGIPGPSFGSGSSIPGRHGSDQALRPSRTGNGPLNPAVTEGFGAVEGRFPGQSIGSGRPPFGSEAGAGSPTANTPGGAAGEALSPSLSSNGLASPAGTVGGGGPGGLSPAPSSGTGREPNLSGGTGTSGSVSRPGRPGTQLRKPPKKLSKEEAAAIGLGVAGGAFALGALAASIANAVQIRKRQQKEAAAIAAAAGGGRSCPGCKPTTCVGNCGGRKRRSIPASKVPAEVLDNIPMNFEHLF